MPGHPRFAELVEEIKKLHELKNKDYGSDEDPLANFHRVAKWMALYPDMNWAQPELVAILYSMKQLDAYLSMMERGVEGTNETCGTRLGDDYAYKILARILDEERIVNKCQSIQNNS